MKNIIIVTALTTFALFCPKTEASNVAESLCEYVNADNKGKLRSYLKTNKLKIRQVFDGVSCNGQNLLEFAATKNSTKTGSMMIGKLPKKVVAANLTTLASTSLATAADKRVNG